MLDSRRLSHTRSWRRGGTPLRLGSNGKIQRAEQMKVHTMFVIGKRDMEADAVSVRVHGKGNLGAKPRREAVAEILQSIKERRPGQQRSN
jgi:threonyl-tRNA synthetase